MTQGMREHFFSCVPSPQCALHAMHSLLFSFVLSVCTRTLNIGHTENTLACMQGFADAAYLDASLTCCIAFSFLFNGLVDLKLISERNASTWYDIKPPCLLLSM